MNWRIPLIASTRKKYLQNELAKKGQNYDAVVPVEMSEREHEFLVTREQVQSHGGRSSLITIGQNKHSVAAVCVCVCVVAQIRWRIAHGGCLSTTKTTTSFAPLKEKNKKMKNKKRTFSGVSEFGTLPKKHKHTFALLFSQYKNRRKLWSRRNWKPASIATGTVLSQLTTSDWRQISTKGNYF
jgi:hypothetical protein